MDAYTTRVIPSRSVYPPQNINLSPLYKKLVNESKQM